MLNAAMSSLAYDAQVPVDYPLFVTPDGPTEADANIQSLGLKDKFNLQNSPVIINFYLPMDSALGSWTANNALRKPQDDIGYKYTVGLGVFYENWSAQGTQRRYLMNPANLSEAMGYAVQSRTVAAGANGRTNGCIASKVNMSDEFEFNTAHSAEWVKPLQKTHGFWLKLADAFRLKIITQ